MRTEDPLVCFLSKEAVGLIENLILPATEKQDSPIPITTDAAQQMSKCTLTKHGLEEACLAGGSKYTFFMFANIYGLYIQNVEC